MMQTVRTFLMFEGNAEAAMRRYVEIFDGARITKLDRWSPGGPGTEGTVYQGAIALGGQTIMFTDSPVSHDFTFTPATSLWVDCASAAEVDAKAALLSDGGSFLMPPGDYGFSERFAWVADRYGVSWQLCVAGAAPDEDDMEIDLDED